MIRNNPTMASRKFKDSLEELKSIAVSEKEQKDEHE